MVRIQMQHLAAILSIMISGLSMGQAIAPSSIKDESQRVMSYLGVLSGWQQQLGVMLRQCNTTLPAGSEERQAIYDEWKARNRNQLDRADQYLKDLVPQFMPARPNIDPLRALEAATIVELSLQLHSIPEDSMRKTCASFREVPSRLDQRLEPLITEAFQSIDLWKERRKNP